MTSADDHAGQGPWPRINDLVHEPMKTLPPIEGYQSAELVSLEEAVQYIKGLLPGIEKRASEAKKKCNQTGTHGLSIDESASIRLYTMEWSPPEICLYPVLNKTLRDEDRDKLKPWFRYLKLFFGGLVKLTPTARPIFRGVKINFTQPFARGNIFTWWGMSSCTEFLHVLKKHKFLGDTGERTLFYIDSYSAVDIQDYSRFKTESELILLPASQFLVVSCLDVGNGLHIVHLKEIEPKYPMRPNMPIPTSLPTTDAVTTMQPRTTTASKHDNSKVLRSIRSHPHRSPIDLSKQNVIDEDIPVIITEGMEEKQCPKLDLQGNNITWSGIAILAQAIRRNTTLEELNLSGNHCHDAGVIQLTKGLSAHDIIYTPTPYCCGLSKVAETAAAPIKTLDLSGNHIADGGARAVAELIAKKGTLTILYLNDNQIGNEGMKYLADALGQQETKLQKLYLKSNTRITDESVNTLIPMFPKNQSLEVLSLQYCSLSDQGKATLQRESSSKKNFFF